MGINIDRCKQCGNKFPDIKSSTIPIIIKNGETEFQRVFNIQCKCGMRTVNTFSEKEAINIWNKDYRKNKNSINSNDKVTYKNIESFINTLSDNSYITISKMADNNVSVEDVYIHINEINEVGNLTFADRADISRQSYVMFNEYNVGNYPHGWAIDVSMIFYRQSSESVKKKSADEAISEIIFIPAISDNILIYDTTTNTLDTGDNTYYISKLTEKKFNLRWTSSDSVYKMLNKELEYDNKKIGVKGRTIFRYMKRDEKYYYYKPYYTSNDLIAVSRSGGNYNLYGYNLYNFRKREEVWD